MSNLLIVKKDGSNKNFNRKVPISGILIVLAVITLTIICNTSKNKNHDSNILGWFTIEGNNEHTENPQFEAARPCSEVLSPRHFERNII